MGDLTKRPEPVRISLNGTQKRGNPWVRRRLLAQTQKLTQRVNRMRGDIHATERSGIHLPQAKRSVVVAKGIEVEEDHPAPRLQVMANTGRNEDRLTRLIGTNLARNREREFERCIKTNGDNGNRIAMRRKPKAGANIRGTRPTQRDARRRLMKARWLALRHYARMISFQFHDIPILVAAAGFAAMGTGALFAPLIITRQFDIGTLTVAGRNEIRAVYGGFGLAMAAMLTVALWCPSLRTGICLTTAAALAGMAAGRIASAIADSRIPGYPLFYLVLETVVAAMLFHVA
ncbi:MAG: DUF4345 family protein [Alphaproteobacteria bacterium]